MREKKSRPHTHTHALISLQYFCYNILNEQLMRIRHNATNTNYNVENVIAMQINALATLFG